MPFTDKIKNGQVYIIAEMSANHAGRLENALELVRAAKKAGADCFKMQTYTPDTMTIPCDGGYFRINGGPWDGASLYELYKQACTPFSWHRPLMEACAREGLDFLSTPFDQSAVDFLEELGVDAYKIASFELVDIPLIEYAASKKKPMLLSCGMASPEEISDALGAIRTQGGCSAALLKCCSEYPANYADMNLSVIADMKERFGLPVGLSDHSPGSLAAVVAVSLGACIIEKHLCLSREIKTPDSGFSMEPSEFAQMVKDVRSARTILGRPTYELSERERQGLAFRRSIFAVRDIKKGERFTQENIRIIRPGYGLSPKSWYAVLGKTARCDIEKGTPVSDGQFA